MPTLRERPYLLLVLPAVVLVLALALLEAQSPGSYSPDTVSLIEGVGQADRCLDAGTLRGCGLGPHYFCTDAKHCVPAGHYSGVGPFPLLQYLPTWGLKHLGASPAGAVRWLIVLSGLAALLLLALVTWTCARRYGRQQSALIAIALIASPLL